VSKTIRSVHPDVNLPPILAPVSSHQPRDAKISNVVLALWAVDLWSFTCGVMLAVCSVEVEL